MWQVPGELQDGLPVLDGDLPVANHVVAASDRDWSSPRFLFVGREWERKLSSNLPSGTEDPTGSARCFSSGR